MVLLTVMFAALLLVSFVGAVGVLTKKNLSDVGRQVLRSRARYAAKAGVSAVISQLSSAPTWEVGYTNVPLTTDPQANYTVEVFNNWDGTKSPNLAPDGITWVPPGSVWIRAIGKVNETVDGSAGLLAIAGNFRPRFDHAVFGVRQVNVSGGSQILPYSSDPINFPTVPDSAHVGSSALGSPCLAIDGSIIQGAAISGVSSDENSPGVISITGGSTITGGRQSAEESKSVKAFQPGNTPDLARDLTLAGAGNHFNLEHGGTIAPPATETGTYGNVVIQDGANLVLRGTTRTDNGFITSRT